ncbi:hypothetical protein F4776DRAFT_660604 [Hypoxylon sp. NC0597]|nr:hypothetical protein F4776DRAFT_660604 [Hypoxylon sp. NC0597]
MGGHSRIFHQFPQLPIELRFKIWANNLPGPRIVEIKCNPLSTSELEQGDNKHIRCTSTSPIPVNLHVCRESRHEALRKYWLLFGFPTAPGRIYLDPLRDTLYFGSRKGVAAAETLFSTFVSLAQPEDLAHVRHIAINEVLINYGTQNSWTNNTARLTAEEILCQAYQYFVNIEQLTFVCDDENPIYSSEAVFIEPRVPNRILERRIREAINAVGDQQPRSRSLIWSVQVIAAEPNCPKYDQRILGYEGTRRSFFNEYHLPQHEKALVRLRSAVCIRSHHRPRLGPR